MQTKTFAAALGLVAAVGTSPPARAGECATNSFGLRSELAFPTYNGGAIGFDQPFATVAQTLLSFTSSQGCGGPCPSNQSIGDVECGDLVTTPLEVEELVAGLGQFDVAQYQSRLLPNGKWEFGADALIEALPLPTVKTATINVAFGHREVFDVTSAESAPQSFRLRLRETELVPVGVQGCPGIFRPTMGREAQLRVQAQGAIQQALSAYLGGALGGPPTRAVTRTTTNPEYGRVIREWDFDLEIPANGVLLVDLLYDPVSRSLDAPVGDPPSTCDLTIMASQWNGPDDGIQLFVSPGAALSAVPRSGIVYAPVPEAGASASGALALGALVLLRKRD